MGKIRVVEELSGVGDVHYEGQFICRVPYRLTVYQRMIDAGGSEIPDVMGVHGYIQADTEATWRLFNNRSHSTLTLEDGRKFDFILIDNSGRVVVSGNGIYT